MSVPKSQQLVATSEGLLQRRRLLADGSPQCVPFYPHEFAQRRSDLGVLDYSALPIETATPDDFDPLERERLKQLVDRFQGDASLVGLRDDEIDGALGLVRQHERKLVPTVAGLLILGKEAALRLHLPAHEVAFQVMEGTDVRVNEFYRSPLLKTFETVFDQFKAQRVEKEIQFGLFRVPVPNYDLRAFREAFVNSLIHRDYTRLGATHVRWESDQIVISNPGGFVEGVTLDNLLIVEPRPRNPLLADAIKRIGLVEAHGVKKGRTFTLAAALYREIGETEGYVRQAGFDTIQQEQMVLKYVRKQGEIGRKDAAADLCRISKDQASRLLRKLLSENKLVMEGKGRGVRYRLP